MSGHEKSSEKLTMSLQFKRGALPMNSTRVISLFSARHWHIGVAAAFLVMGHLAQAATIVTKTSFDYDTTTGALKKTVVEYDDSNLCLVTEYTPDDYGHAKETTTRNCAGRPATPAGSPAEAPEPGGMAGFPSRRVVNDYSSDQRFITKVTNPLLQEETKGYDPRFGAVTSHTALAAPNDPTPLTTTWAYDGLGRKRLETRPDGTRTRWNYVYCRYDSEPDWQWGNPVIPAGAETGPCERVPAAFKRGAYYVGPSTVRPIYYIQTTPLRADGVTPNGPYTRVYFDSLGREIRTETQGSDVSGVSQLVYKDLAYDFYGNLIRKGLPYTPGSGPQYIAGHTYDVLGRVTRVYEGNASGGPASTWTTYSGLRTTVEDPKGNRTTQVRNAVGQVETITNAKNATLTRAYDPLGNLVRTTDALGNVISLEYDKRGRKTRLYDPDMGVWGYCYDALGQIKAQQDPNGRGSNAITACPAVRDMGLVATPLPGWSTMAYDPLGRMTQRYELGLRSTWTYDACNKGVGKLCSAVTDDAYSRTHVYDNLGRPSRTSFVRNGTTYTSSVAYDSDTGRVSARTYPAGAAATAIDANAIGLTINQSYTSLGYLLNLVDTRNGAELWRAQQQDALGHYLRSQAGNGLITSNVYFDDGRLRTSKTGPGDSVQNLLYSYDLNRNIRTRADVGTGVTATYGYDELNRLTSESRSGVALGGTAQVIGWDYDAIGNMTARTESGATNTYLYNTSGLGSLRPHAVAGVSGEVNAALAPTYRYDLNGNLTTGAGRTVVWTAANMVSTVSASGGAQLRFKYSPERERFEEIYARNGVDQRATVYIAPADGAGVFFEEESGVAGTKIKHYVRAGDQTVAMIVCTAAPCTSLANTSTQYWHEDHLGSVSAVTSQSGAVAERMAYEPFGKRRLSNGVTDPNGTLVPVSTDRGFTEHEHMDEVGLINMNGRVYDAALGRFLSADPTLPDPEDLQSYNRYSYTLNNPVGLVDPSGFSSASVGISFDGSSFSFSFNANRGGGEACAICSYPFATWTPSNGNLFGGLPVGSNLGKGYSTLSGSLDLYSTGSPSGDSKADPSVYQTFGAATYGYQLAFDEMNKGTPRSAEDWRLRLAGLNELANGYRATADRFGLSTAGDPFMSGISLQIAIAKAQSGDRTAGLTQMAATAVVIGLQGGGRPAKGPDIALGLGRVGGDANALGNFSRRVGGLNYHQWESAGLGRWDGPFEPFFRQASSKAGTIHFSLDGIDVAAALKAPINFSMRNNVTNSELRTILENKSLLDKTVFYRGGQVVPAPR